MRHGRVADRAVDVDHPAAGAADEVVVVVADAVLVAGRRAGRLDAPEEAVVGEDGEGVVDRLARDGADLGPHGRVDVVGRAVRQVGHRRSTARRCAVTCRPCSRSIVSGASVVTAPDRSSNFWNKSRSCRRTDPAAAGGERRAGSST